MWKFSRFAVVGLFGFSVDSAAFLLLNFISDNLLLNRVIAFWLAATATWIGNRYFTFSATKVKKLFQFTKHFIAAHITGVLNISCFYFLLQYFDKHFAFVVGIAVGMFSNYALSSKLVYQKN